MRAISILAAGMLLCSCSFVSVKGGNFKHTTIVRASGDIVEKTYELDGFDIIDLSGSYEVNYTPGDFYVSVSAPENLIDHIKVEVRNGSLCFGSDGTMIRNWKNATATVHCPVLSGVAVSGAADFNAEQGIVSDDFTVDVSGAGDIEIHSLTAENVTMKVSGAVDIDVDNLDCNSIVVRISGAGDIDIEGKAEKADLIVSGAGTIDARNLKCEDITSSVSGIGSVRR